MKKIWGVFWGALCIIAGLIWFIEMVLYFIGNYKPTSFDIFLSFTITSFWMIRIGIEYLNKEL